MLIDEYLYLSELQKDLEKIRTCGQYTQEQVKQRQHLHIKDFFTKWQVTPDLVIDSVSDAAQEMQDFSVFEIVETLREYNECSNSH